MKYTRILFSFVMLSVLISCLGNFISKDKVMNQKSAPERVKSDFEPVTKTTEFTEIDPVDKEFPGGRGTDELIIYTPKFGKATGTNEYGAEAVVVGGHVIKCGDNNSEIPEGGYVVSGHGKAKDWVMRNLPVGAFVYFEGKKQIISSITLESFKFEYKDIDSEIEKRLADLTAKNLVPSNEFAHTRQNAGNLISEGEKLVSEGYGAEAGNKFKEAVRQIKTAYAMTMPSYLGEKRGVWYRLTEKNSAELEKSIKRIADAGFNMIFPETIYYGTSICPPPVDILSQNPDYAGWDPLYELVRISHKYGIEVHAWVHVFFAGFKDNPGEVPSKSPLLDLRPDWFAQNKNGGYEAEIEKGYYFLCPSNKYVRKALIVTYKELVKRYDIDGLHLDYIRYTFSQPVDKGYCYCNSCRTKFFDKYKADPAMLTPEKDPRLWKKWDEFREEQITSFVEEVNKELKAMKPAIKISAAVFPDPQEAMKLKFQNWQTWVKSNYLDFLCPMIYYTDEFMIGRASSEIKSVTGNKCGMYAGLELFETTPALHLLKQIQAAEENGANGIILFSLNQLTDEAIELLGKGPFREREIKSSQSQNKPG